MKKIFKEFEKLSDNDKKKANNYSWKEIKTFLVRNQYNEILTNVAGEYFKNQYSNKDDIPTFLNTKYCLTLENFLADCTCGDDQIILKADSPKNEKMAIWNSKCDDDEKTDFCLPIFKYNREVQINDKENNFSLSTNGLTVGSVLWLYYYERMGIFKILGALMDDYNYRGKYTISGNRNNNSYSVLMDSICTLHRLGLSSNLRDRICTYQKVLGVSIENNLNIESEQNTGFMRTFNKLMDHMLEYYKAKQLAVAINSTSGPQRSSVATQTSIFDTMKLLKQQFEPLQYGRNQINTFLGIATVHATLALLFNIRKEIGIPDQYNSPEEFIPAAYDILVAKKPLTLNESNRFIIYDNCATYGYRLLTDVEKIDLTQVNIIALGSSLDIWLNDVEGWVEGYRNAYASVPDRVEAIV